jgi:hydrogenase maturation protease
MTEKPSEGSQSLTNDTLRKVVVIGIGNKYRSDDGIGLFVAQQIHKKYFSFITIKEESGEGAALMEAWQGFHDVMIVDAVSSGAKPGTIFRIDAHKDIVPIKFFHTSTHAFSVAEAIEVARAMNTLPPRLLVYGIEGANFSAGVTVSHGVQESGKQVVEQILSEIRDEDR